MRIDHDPPDVCFVDNVPYGGRTTAALDLDRERDRELHRRRLAPFGCDVGERHAVPFGAEADARHTDPVQLATATLLEDDLAHALLDARPRGRIGETGDERIVATGQRPRREQRGRARRCRIVGVLVDRDVQPFTPRRLDQRQRACAPAPLRLAHQLVVRELSGQLALPGDADQFRDGVDRARALVPDVR